MVPLDWADSRRARVQAAIVYLNVRLCEEHRADDGGWWGYRAVKRFHIIIHILRCMVGMCVPSRPQPLY
jgi:hypothetical protein